MTNFEIRKIDHNSKHLSEVIALADRNSSTLGHLPREGFKDYAAKKWILVALTLDDIQQVIGFLVYRKPMSTSTASIAYLCVDEGYRGRGIARELFEELRKITKPLSGINLVCRRDYEQATKMWQAFGFYVTGESRGRSKEGSWLTHWRFDHGHKTLFDIAETEKLNVAIDANIFFDYFTRSKDEVPWSHALFNDWVQQEVDYFVTRELKTEINRNENDHIREKNLKRVEQFNMCSGDSEKHRQLVADLLELLTANDDTVSDNTLSDIKHLAWAILDKRIEFFVTRDEGVLRQSLLIDDKFDLYVIEPSNLLLHLDELVHMSEYRHKSFGGTNFTQRRIQSGELKSVADAFSFDEKNAVFLQYLRQYLVDFDEHNCYIIEDDKSIPIALYVEDRSHEYELNIPVLRLNEKHIDKTLVRYLLFKFLRTSALEKRSCTRISEKNLHPLLVEALHQDSFAPHHGNWVKPSLLIADTSKAVAEQLNDALANYDGVKTYFRVHISLLRQEWEGKDAIEPLLDLEKILWPIKITDVNIPSITVPIYPVWASQWFDEELANNTLWGAERKKAFNREGVYYTTRAIKDLPVPGRVLWYVTSRKGVVGSKSIRACSRLEEFVVGTAKELFKTFRHLGIYEWQDLIKLTADRTDVEIAAIRFSDTLLFENPIDLDEWQEISLDLTGRNTQHYSASTIRNDVFNEIYRRGMGLKDTN